MKDQLTVVMWSLLCCMIGMTVVSLYIHYGEWPRIDQDVKVLSLTISKIKQTQEGTKYIELTWQNPKHFTGIATQKVYFAEAVRPPTNKGKTFCDMGIIE